MLYFERIVQRRPNTKK